MSMILTIFLSLLACLMLTGCSMVESISLGGGSGYSKDGRISGQGEIKISFRNTRDGKAVR